MTPQELLDEADAINKFLTNEDGSPDMMDFVDIIASAETKLREAAETIRILQEQLTDARM